MKRKVSKKTAALILSVSLLLGATLGGTLAWLTDTTEEVTNTFTVSNVELELKETTEVYKMIPGWTIEKDPLVTVKEGSEDCWVFLEVTKTADLDNYIRYAIDSNNWTKLDIATEKNVAIYYCFAKDITADRNIKVLAGGSYTYNNATPDDETDDITCTWKPNQVLTKPEVTEQMMEALEADGATLPQLSFRAYASQYYKTNNVPFEPVEAWNLVKDLPDNSSN